MRRVTTGPISVTAAVASAGVWIAMATRWPARAPMAQQTVVSKTQSVSGMSLQLRHHGHNYSKVLALGVCMYLHCKTVTGVD